MRKSSPRRKDVEKVNFQTVFPNICYARCANLIPIVKILSMPPKISQEWKVYPPNVQVGEENFLVYIQNEAYERDGTVNKVIIKHADISDDTIISSLKDAIDQYNSVTVLRLIDCCLTYEELYIIHRILKKHRNIIDLNIDENPNAKQNFFIIMRNCNLQYLSMQKCKINDRGAKYIGKELSESSLTLISLDLSSNSISDEGAKELAKGLRVNRSIVSLLLPNNWITDNGVDELMKVFRNFELTHDEIQIRRGLNFQYEFKKLQLQEQFKKESSKVKERIQSAEPQTRKKTLKKEKSVSTISGRRTSKTARANYSNRLEQFMETNLKRTNHPFETDCVAENNVIICSGNFKVAYLNIAYNKITNEGLQCILETLQYQNTIPVKQDVGLTNIVLNGNNISECATFEDVKILIQEKILRYMSQSSRRRNSLKK